MFRYSDRKLKPRQQRAHAGHTHVVGSNGGHAPSFAALCESGAAVPPHLTFARRIMKPLRLQLVMFLVITIVACDQVGDESAHKIVFPQSAKNIQNLGNSQSVLPDRGIATILDIDRQDLDAFLAQLKITDRRSPAKGQGDPKENGWNVWPQEAKTFVPVNKDYGGFKKTWNALPVPEEMLSCKSTAGDWLHVEVWGLPENRVLLKLYTDWN